MRVRKLAAMLALATQAVPPAGAKDATILAPSGPWQLNYADDSCQLARGFGQGDDMVLLYLEQFRPGFIYNAKLIGKPFKSTELHVKIGLSESGSPMMAVGALSGTIDKRPMVAFTVMMLPELPPEAQMTPFTRSRKDEIAKGYGGTLFGIMAAARLRQLHINPPAGPDLVLQTGAMDKTISAMQTCMDGLIKRWGLDPAEQRTLRQGPKPLSSPGTWVTSDDYPASELRNGASAIVNFRVMVDTAGNVGDCAIQRATQGPEFSKKTCALIRRRARFEPALNAQGNPVASYFINTVKWLAGTP